MNLDEVIVVYKADAKQFNAATYGMESTIKTVMQSVANMSDLAGAKVTVAFEKAAKAGTSRIKNEMSSAEGAVRASAARIASEVKQVTGTINSELMKTITMAQAAKDAAITKSISLNQSAGNAARHAADRRFNQAIQSASGQFGSNHVQAVLNALDNVRRAEQLSSPNGVIRALGWQQAMINLNNKKLTQSPWVPPQSMVSNLTGPQFTSPWAPKNQLVGAAGAWFGRNGPTPPPGFVFNKLGFLTPAPNPMTAAAGSLMSLMPTPPPPPRPPRPVSSGGSGGGGGRGRTPRSDEAESFFKRPDFSQMFQNRQQERWGMGGWISRGLELYLIIGAWRRIIGSMHEAATASLTLAANYQTAQVSFEVMTGSAERGAQLMNDVIQLALETPFTSDRLMIATKQLKAFGIETEALVPTLGVLGEVSSATGTDLERIILAFGQTQVAGRLLGTELRQFTDAGVPMIEHLAMVMKKPKETIRGMITEGEVSSARVVEAFNAMTRSGGRFAGMMDRINRTTVQGRFENLKEVTQQKLKQVGESFYQGFDVLDMLDKTSKFVGGFNTSNSLKFFQDMKFGVDSVAGSIMYIYDCTTQWIEANKELVTQITTGFKQGLGISLGIVMSLVGGVISLVKWTAEWAKKNPEVAKTIATVTGALLGLTIAVGAASFAFRVFYSVMVVFTGIKSIVSIVVSLASAFLSIFTPAGLVIASVIALTAAITGLLYALGGFEGFGTDFGKMFSEMGKVGLETWDGLIKAVKAGDMQAAFDLAFGYIEFGWKQLLFNMKAEWIRFQSNISGVNPVHKPLARGMNIAQMHAEIQVARLSGDAPTTGENDKTRAIRAKYAAIDQNIVNIGNEAIQAQQRETEAYIENLRTIELSGPRDKIQAQIRNAKYPQLSDKMQFAMGYAITPITPDRYVTSTGNVSAGLAGLGGIAGYSAQISSRDQILKHAAAIGAYGDALNMARSGSASPELIASLPDLKKSAEEATEAIMKMSKAAKDASAKFYEAPVKMGISSQANKLFESIQKEVMEGTTPLEKFKKYNQHLNETYYGVKGRAPRNWVERAMMAATGVADEKQFTYGKLKGFEELTKAVQDFRESPLPGAVMFASKESQEIIARSSQQAQTTQELIYKTLQAAQLSHESREKVAKDTRAILERIEKNGGINGGTVEE